MTRKWRWVGDRALRVELDEPDPVAACRAAQRLSQQISLTLQNQNPQGVDVIAAARSVLVVLPPGIAPGRKLLEALEGAEPDPDDSIPRSSFVQTIPVRYGGEEGPDLSEVAAIHQMSEAEVVRLHSSTQYTVGFLGFAPGFAYLLGLPAALETPRLESPRPRVPAGSVAIGGPYTGVYPSATPGGWRIIGRTDADFHDYLDPVSNKTTPKPRVRFIPGQPIRFAAVTS